MSSLKHFIIFVKTESPILSTTVPSMTTESIHDTPTLPAHIKPKHMTSIGSNSPSIKHNTGDTPEVYFKQTGEGFDLELWMTRIRKQALGELG